MQNMVLFILIGRNFYSSTYTERVIRGSLGFHGWSYKRACCYFNRVHIGSKPGLQGPCGISSFPSSVEFAVWKGKTAAFTVRRLE